MRMVHAVVRVRAASLQAALYVVFFRWAYISGVMVFSASYLISMAFAYPRRFAFTAFALALVLPALASSLKPNSLHQWFLLIRAAAIFDGQRQKRVASAGKSCSSRTDTSFICENSFNDFRQLQTGQSRCRQKSALCNLSTLLRRIAGTAATSSSAPRRDKLTGNAGFVYLSRPAVKLEKKSSQPLVGLPGSLFSVWFFGLIKFLRFRARQRAREES